MDKYAVIGSPIGHSLSPRIHAAFAAQTGQSLRYDAIEVRPDNFFDQLNRLQSSDYKGVNITLPLKGLAWETADSCDENCNRAQAVNVLKFESDGRRLGFNTDGIGLLRDLTENHHIDLKNKRILIVGAGGAVRGVLAPLLSSSPKEIRIANRTSDKALWLAKQFEDLGPIQACALTELGNERYDVIINGTSAGLNNEIPALPDNLLEPTGVIYDMLYGKQPTAFVRWGKTQGAERALDGLGMLIEQAAESFYIWRGIRPETAPVLQSLRN